MARNLPDDGTRWQPSIGLFRPIREGPGEGPVVGSSHSSDGGVSFEKCGVLSVGCGVLFGVPSAECRVLSTGAACWVPVLGAGAACRVLSAGAECCVAVLGAGADARASCRCWRHAGLRRLSGICSSHHPRPRCPRRRSRHYSLKLRRQAIGQPALHVACGTPLSTPRRTWHSARHTALRTPHG